MNTAWHLYSVFVSTVAPFLLVTAIPSLIVALTPYPKAAGFLKVLSYVAQVLSVLTHKDSPGTLKPPLVPVFGKTEEPAAGPPGSSLRAFVPLFLIPALLLGGCTPKWKQVITDEASQCGPGLLAAVAKSRDVLMTATSTDAALAEINQILQAAGADASSIWCVVKVALDDLKAQRATSGGLAPAETQLRPLVAGVRAYPTDPVAHGIALGGDILAMRAAP